MPTITKEELAKTLADELDMTDAQARKFVAALFLALREALINGGRIEIRGFGAWQVLETKPRPNSRNPKTGEVVSVPAHKKVHFKPGKELRAELTKPL
ncbi:MAG: integration host factor subunit beta [Candidatus Latescibacteria bacterium]|nr:integration host factor subunit beta [Candidatus Latescibacterota bacterium]